MFRVMEKLECYLATHRVENKRGLGTYYDELSGLQSRIYDLGDIDDSNQNLPGMNIIEENSELLGLLDSVVQRKVKQLICHFSKYSPDLVHAWQDETILTSSIAAALTGIPILIGSARFPFDLMRRRTYICGRGLIYKVASRRFSNLILII